ncbi:hypothetical protein EJB05_13193, partial [Eragrostis curvula]
MAMSWSLKGVEGCAAMALGDMRHRMVVELAVDLEASEGAGPAGNLESIQEVETEHTDFAITGDDDTSRWKELISLQYPKSATTGDSSSEKDCTGPESSEESFVTDDDRNSNASQEEDEEYFIFAGRGKCYTYLLSSVHNI